MMLIAPRAVPRIGIIVDVVPCNRLVLWKKWLINDRKWLKHDLKHDLNAFDFKLNELTGHVYIVLDIDNARLCNLLLTSVVLWQGIVDMDFFLFDEKRHFMKNDFSLH